MPRLRYTEAAGRLRMTVHLLRWFSRNPANGRRLQFDAQGTVDENDLIAFNQNLWSAWPTRAVPTGVSNELRLEACGHCGICSTPFDVLDEAHIARRGVERDDYCQHPHNLILACGAC